MVSVRPPFLRMRVPPLRRHRAGYAPSGLFVAALLGGALALERYGLWPDAFKTALQRHHEAQRAKRARDLPPVASPEGRVP